MRTISTLLLLAVLMTLAPGGTTTASAASCYWAQFVADVTIPDGTNFAPNTAFKKTWRIKNIGSCAWSSDVSLIFDSGERMGAPASLALPTTVNPGQTVDITVDMTSPAAAGHYFGYWKFKSTNFGGTPFGIGSNANKSFWVEIRVNSGSTAGYDFTANAGSAQWTSGAGALTFPAPDNNANGFAFKVDQPKLESGVTSAQAGLLFGPNNVTNGFTKATYPAFRVQNGDRFQTTIGCEYGATNCYVTYSLYYKIGSGPETTLWTFREKYEGWTYNVNLDLSRLANQDVTFILVTSAYGSPTGDRALWVNPIIARAGGSPPPPPPTVTGTPPTITPTVTGTVLPNACDRAQFIADVTVRDGTTFAPGTAFNKTWRLKNVGTCTWTNYSIMFDSGEKMGGPDSALIPATVAPGQTVDITLPLVAPAASNTYRGNWKLKSNTGVPFGIGSAGTKTFWVEIKVSGTGGVTPGTPTKTNTPGAPVTPATAVPGTVYDFAANVCAAKWYSGAGELPCPGVDGDAKGFVLIANPSRLENGTTDPRTGIITFPQNQNNGYIQGIYPSYQVKAGDKFRATIGCEVGATACYVVFRLDYSISGSSSIQTFWAFVEKHEGGVYNAEIDLTPLAGQSVKFVLTVLATGPATGDRALWTAPMIYNASSAPAPSATPTGTATVTPTATNTTTAPSATPTPTATGTATPTNTVAP